MSSANGELMCRKWSLLDTHLSIGSRPTALEVPTVPNKVELWSSRNSCHAFCVLHLLCHYRIYRDFCDSDPCYNTGQRLEAAQTKYSFFLSGRYTTRTVKHLGLRTPVRKPPGCAIPHPRVCLKRVAIIRNLVFEAALCMTVRLDAYGVICIWFYYSEVNNPVTSESLDVLIVSKTLLAFRFSFVA